VIYLQLFLAFFTANMLGYGGGPSVIPLIEHEVVEGYGWMDSARFAEVLALGNTLPGPIATKMAGYIGYEQAGILGSLVALIATVVPTVLIMILLLNAMMRFKDSPRVQNITLVIQPAIAAMLLIMAVEFLVASHAQMGMLHTAIIALASLLAMERFKIHPFFVIVASLIYGFILL